jgi:hypothetical protein
MALEIQVLAWDRYKNVAGLYKYIDVTPTTRDFHGCDRMVVGLLTTYAISAYH